MSLPNEVGRKGTRYFTLSYALIACDSAIPVCVCVCLLRVCVRACELQRQDTQVQTDRHREMTGYLTSVLDRMATAKNSMVPDVTAKNSMVLE